jgi:uncharacterized membrane protein
MQLLLRVIHIVCGAMWVGFVVFVSVILLPALRGAGPAAGPMMYQVARVRKLPLVNMAIAVLTVLSGLALYWQDSAGFSNAWMQSGAARTFGAGGAVAIIAIIIGMAISSPAGRKLGQLAGNAIQRGGAPTPEEAAEMQRLQMRMAQSNAVVAILVVIAAGIMAVARYVQ